ncbi:carboxypeptidase-like regulatory domain-containing protein [Flavobacterium sp. SUN052]|jgi:CarboxypepD_reg-like domain|uniref:carboxypeptidase-like regulatory domain-containing protein n=1 Tax=Flavobacterium sp. SUN052 TaxID=3002441 RepID=UPI00237E2A41|nr:carboxypeptidase-like regulatory domain-containing protein [Flavobacterium sp. SUN052]MEC4005232.1 carboxypeptidase-like regulatory domain-containing protein [Flavobacterium sp. SUN052]
MTKIVTIIIGLTLLTSCDCYQRISGIVIDKETGRPLAGVTVYNKSKVQNKTTTDSIGHFELSSISGGFRCPPMNIVIKADNYKTIESSIPPGGQDIIKLTSDLNIDHIKNIRYVFDDYVQYEESTDSQNDKNLMSKSLKSLTIVTKKDELDLLINVWMYYDPTDYPDIPEIYRIFKNSRPYSIEAVKKRIDKKKEWEKDETVPYSDLKNLLERLANE